METIKKGSKGEAVRTLQRLLGIKVDGDFGPATEKAVVQFQKSKGITADGIVGNKTWALLGVKDEIEIVNNHINIHVTRLPNRQIKYIAIHYTAGKTSKAGAAIATRNAFLKSNASADFVVDDETIVQVNPDIRNYYCWAVGDRKNVYTGGGSLYGKATNKNTISIEICSNLKRGTTANIPNHEGWYFTEKSLANALKLVRYLMGKYNIPKSNVVRHYDISGKLCPGIIGWNCSNIYNVDGMVTSRSSNSNKWKEFWSKI